MGTGWGATATYPGRRTLDKMLWLARALGEGFAFARVDLYEAEGRVYFGEITFTEANRPVGLLAGRATTWSTDDGSCFPRQSRSGA